MSQQKAPKFVIRPFKTNKQLSSLEAQAIWNFLATAINEVYNKNASKLSYEELYRNAYNLVLHKHGDLLYNGVKAQIRGHLEADAERVACTPSDDLLSCLSSIWQDHRITMKMIKDILLYMDRDYVQNNKKASSYNLGLQIFLGTIIHHARVRDRLREILLENIKNERNGCIIDRDLMKTILSMLNALSIDGVNVYEEDFEQFFLDSTRTFYREESLTCLSQMSCPEYLKKVEIRLNEEASRVHHYLSLSTEAKLKHIVETELLTNHAKALVDMENSGCIQMMTDKKLDDLKRMYNLFNRVPSTLDHLRDCISEHAKHCGMTIISDQERVNDPLVFVTQLLELKSEFDKIVTECCRSDKKTQKRLKDAFEEFINKDTKCASYLASYIDELLRNGLRGLREEEIELAFDRIITIFRFLQDKDIFENFYKSHLSRRLLGGKSISDDYERNMIARLKSECGYQFTSKLEGMFTDMKISESILTEYRESIRARSAGSDASGITSHTNMNVELEVTVLTTGYWPVQCLTTCTLPAVIIELCDSFTAFYLHRHSGRKLSWLSHLGTAEIKTEFASGRKELIVSTYQMSILMLFQDVRRQSISLTEIREKTNIVDVELRRHLLSLCTPKCKILNKFSKGKGITDDDTFSFNEEFNSKHRRVKVPMISSKDISSSTSSSNNTDEAGGGGDSVPVTVEEDRRHSIEAAIVRVMKARKRMTHNDLVAEVSHQLSARFVPNLQIIKKRIESLIEREYLQRDKDDRRFYNYLA